MEDHRVNEKRKERVIREIRKREGCKGNEKGRERVIEKTRK